MSSRLGEDSGVRLWLYLWPLVSGVSGMLLLPNVKRDDRCRRIVLFGCSEGVCDCCDWDDARDTGKESGGVTDDLALPVSLFANFFRGDMDLESVLVAVVALLERLGARLLFSEPLGGVAR